MAGGHSLIGREAEKAGLLGLLETAGEEKPGLVLVAGEAGIGKSALVEEVLAGIDRPILRGGSTPGATTPYGPLVQILRACLRNHRDELPRLPLAKHLSLLLPELDLGDVDTDLVTLHAAICDCAALAGDDRPVWVLEDLHWGDQGTLDALLELASVPERSGLRIVATYRNDELPRLHRLRRVRSELRRAGRLHEIVLDPLSREETDELVDEIAGSDLPGDVRRAIFERSDGVPFFVEELAAATNLVGRPVAVERDGVDSLPETLRDAIRLRSAGLDPDESEILEVMAAAGLSIELPLLAELTDPDAVTRLIERGWMVDVDGNTVSFRHALVREAIYADIPWLQRREHHRALAEALEAHGAPPEEIARHWSAARDVLRARPLLLRAARSFCALHAYRDARSLLTDALGEWEVEGPDPERLSAVELLARCTELGGERDDAIRLWREVAAAREELDDAEGLAQARRRLAGLLELGSEWAEAIAARLAAAEGFDACAQPADATAERLAVAAHLRSAGDVDTALELVERARADAAVAGHVDLGLRALALEGEIKAMLGQSGGVVQAQTALDLALSKDDPGLIADGYYTLAMALMVSAEYEGAMDAFSTAFSFCRDRGVQGFGEVCRACLTPTARHVGRWKEATAVCREILGDTNSPPAARHVAAGELGLINALKGNVAAARRLLPPALSFALQNEIFELAIECSWGLSMVAALEGKPEDASTRAIQLIEDCQQRDEWHFSLSAMRWCCTWFAERGAERTLLSAVDVLSTAASRSGYQEARAAFSYGLVEVALLNGDEQRALDQAQETLKLLEGLAPPIEVAAMRARCALPLMSAGQRDAALGNLTAAYRTAKKLGARPLAESIVARFEEWGEPIEPHLGRRAGERAERGGLSQRELDVMRQIAEGRTNKEIAEALFLSTRTVDMHVRNILMKLGCRSRADAVRRAGELGLLPGANPANTA